MRPGTVHHVVTSKNCIAVGGHFFSSLMFSRTLDAVVVEHFAAEFITNTDHTEVHIVLFKMLQKYADAISAATKERPLKGK